MCKTHWSGKSCVTDQAVPDSNCGLRTCPILKCIKGITGGKCALGGAAVKDGLRCLYSLSFRSFLFCDFSLCLGMLWTVNIRLDLRPQSVYITMDDMREAKDGSSTGLTLPDLVHCVK